MAGFFVRRAIQLILVLIGISTILFFVLRLSGDPLTLLLPLEATIEEREQLREAMGFNDPLPVQYLRFITNAARLEFGNSFQFRAPAIQMVTVRLPATVLLVITSMTIALVVSFPVGIYTATHQRKFGSNLVMIIALLGQSMPVFWLGVLLILIFAVNLRWLPSFGMGTPQHLILPSITLGGFMMAKIARLVRSGIIGEMSREYVVTAYAKGVFPSSVIRVHVLRNMLIPVVTVIGLEVSYMIGGAVIVEIVFAWPGVGRQLVQAVLARDYPLVQATVFVVAIITVLINTCVDLLYFALDPRIRKQ